VTFTLPQTGNYTFVTHNFGDMVKGAAGVLHTAGAPKGAPVTPVPTGGATSPVWPSMVKTAGMSQMSSTAPAPAGTLAASLGDMWLKAPVTSAKAGKVTFTVTNQGQMTHQFAIMKAPVKVNGGTLVGQPLAQSPQLSPGDHATVSATLRAGSYELVCLMPGHYLAGQHLAFTVTG
jgi:uncharacterized cupredoxin-like copper-binding protein